MLGAWPLAWRVGKGRSKERLAFPGSFLNIYSFGCCQLRFPDEMRLVTENWKWEGLPFLRVGLFVDSVQNGGMRVLGSHCGVGHVFKGWQLPSEELEDRICHMYFRKTVDSTCKCVRFKSPLKRYCFC